MQTRRHTSPLFVALLPALAASALPAAAVAALALPAAASAQELTGTYVSYVDTGATGSLVHGARSLAYAEAGGAGGCDVFCQGSYEEGYAIAATAGTTSLAATITTDTSTGMTTLSGPSVSGRSIAWSGSLASGSASLRVDQTVATVSTDRSVSIAVTLRNTGTVTLTDLYYLRGGDPDQGYCGSSVYTTANDVVRQPPTDTSALVTASAGGVVVGLGSFDARARADASSFGLDTPDTRWASPTDPAGATADIAMALVFHVPSLAPGASTTLQMYYVLAASAATLTTRFDALRGSTPTCSEGASCTAGGHGGVCHASACCTGCWDGFACQAGSTATACGTAGGACAGCDDGLGCTTDSCGAGACSSAVASGCLIDGVCEGSGAASPFDACLLCDPARSSTAWSSRSPCGTPDAGAPGEDLGVPGEDLGVPGEDLGVPGVDLGLPTGDGGVDTVDASDPGTRGTRRRAGCDVGAVGASESGGMIALAMLMLVALVRRRERGALGDA